MAKESHFFAASVRTSLAQIYTNYGETVFLDTAQRMVHEIIDLVEDVSSSDKLAPMLYEAADFASTRIKVPLVDLNKLGAKPEPTAPAATATEIKADATPSTAQGRVMHAGGYVSPYFIIGEKIWPPARHFSDGGLVQKISKSEAKRPRWLRWFIADAFRPITLIGPALLLAACLVTAWWL